MNLRSHEARERRCMNDLFNTSLLVLGVTLVLMFF